MKGKAIVLSSRESTGPIFIGMHSFGDVIRITLTSLGLNYNDCDVFFSKLDNFGGKIVVASRFAKFNRLELETRFWVQVARPRCWALTAKNASGLVD